jgi:eukaryotic-like serine/threonine-protein kinase
MFVENNGALQAETVSGGLPGWNLTGDGQLDTSPIVVYDTVYEGSNSGRIYAISAQTGVEEWSADPGEPITGNIVKGDDYLIVPTEGALTLFRPSS